MEVRNCKNCKRLFNYLGGDPICPACKEELEEKFSVVREYVWDHKNATIDQIGEACEVSTKQIKQWIIIKHFVPKFKSVSLKASICP